MTDDKFPEDCRDCMALRTGGCDKLNDNNDCPCGKCIVKMICENFCYTYDEWFEGGY